MTNPDGCTNPELLFDERDHDGVVGALTPFSESIGGDLWEFAKTRARKRFLELLEENGPMTAYLGGMPLDSSLVDGVLQPVYRGLGVVFVLTEPSSLGERVPQISHVVGAAVRPVQKVMAKFWMSAANMMSGRYSTD